MQPTAIAGTATEARRIEARMGTLGTGGPVAEIALLALMAIVLTYFAWRAWPAWDDGALYLMIDADPGGVRNGVRDRPLIGAIWQALIDRGVFWQTSALLYCIAWFGLAVVTRDLWRMLVPSRARLALAPATLAAAPALCQVQFVLVNTVWVLLPCLLAYLALAICLRGSRAVGNVAWLGATVAAGVLVALAVGLAEYGVAATLAASCLLLLAPEQGQPQRARRFIQAGILLATALVVYALFLAMVDADARPGVRPGRAFDDLAAAPLWWARVRGGQTATMLWQGSLGAVLGTWSRVSLLEPQDLIATAAGLGAAVVAFWVGAAGKAPLATPTGAGWRLHRSLPFALGASLLIGMLPVILMGRFPATLNPAPGARSAVESSRFWLPVLPVASCLTVSLLLLLGRPKLRWTIVSGCAFLAFYCTVQSGLKAAHDRQLSREWGTALLARAPEDGLFVVVFDNRSGGPVGMGRDYELTARLTSSWPRDVARRTWAFSSPEEARRQLKPGTTSTYAIDFNLRGLSLKGDVTRCLWFEMTPEGGLREIVEGPVARLELPRAPAGLSGAAKRPS